MNAANLPDETLFEEALKRHTQAERAAFLDQACAGQPELRRKLEVLLKAHDEAGEFLNRPTATLPTTVKVDLAPEEAPGTRIGRYKLLQKIGEGGMGTVYMAEQLEPVVRKVAFKIIKLGMDTRQVVARFEAERQALALMDHPNIAKVLDAGATDTGRPYFVMELVHGVPITEYCDKNKLSAKARLELFVPVCQAIQHAHQKGIIHRDIKPSNVMVTLHDGRPVPRVIDFGVAKATNQRLTEKTLFTNYAQMIGTPAYMSPEQAEMSGLDIDTRSDVYSLGVLLYELLTGTTPFSAKELLSKGYVEMQRIIAEQEPPKPSTRMSTMQKEERTVVANNRSMNASSLHKVLQGDLDWIVMKCLEKDRTRRYETSNALAADLQRHLSNELIAARPPTTSYLLKKLVKRNKVLFVATSAVILALLLGMTLSLWQASRAKRSEALAARRLTDSEKARSDAQALAAFLTDVLQSPNYMKRGRNITVAETLDEAARKLVSDSTMDPSHKALLQTTLAKTFYALGLAKEAIPLHEQARDYYRIKLGPEAPVTLRETSLLAAAYDDAGRRSEALKLNEEVLASRRRVNGVEHAWTIKAMIFLAENYHHEARYEEALQLREQALILSRKVNGREHEDTISAMQGLANSFTSAGRLEEGLALQKEVLELSRKVHGPEHPATLVAMANIGNSHRKLGRWREATALHEEVLAIRRKLLGPEHPETIRQMMDLSVAYREAGSIYEAVKMDEEALALSTKRLGREHPDTIAAIHNLVISYGAAGRETEARQLLEEQLSLTRKVNGPEHHHTIETINSLAYSHAKAGRWSEALKLQEEILPFKRKSLGPEHPETLDIMHNLANSYANVGRVEEAIRLHEEVLETQRKVLGEEHPSRIRGMNNLAISYFDAGRREAALQLREQTLKLCQKVHSPEHPLTLWTIRGLADSYSSMGRFEEARQLRENAWPLHLKVFGTNHAETFHLVRGLVHSYVPAAAVVELLPLLEYGLGKDPGNTQLAMRLAGLQLWFGKADGYAATRQRMLDWAADTTSSTRAGEVVRLACMQASPDGALSEKVVSLARRAIEIRKAKVDSESPWLQLALGMAEYRQGNYVPAEQACLAARSGAEKVSEASRVRIQRTAEFFHAMSLFRQGKQADARQVFAEAEAKMKPMPGADKNPLAGDSDGDDLMVRLACKEARTLLDGPPGANP